MNNLKIFWKRITSESPEFFVKLKKVALSIGGSTAAALFTVQVFSLVVPPIFYTICTYILIASAFTAGTAILPVKDPSQLQNN